jgi:O-antigen ligase
LSAVTHEVPHYAVNAKLIAMIVSGAVFFGVFLSGFVIDEPAPYDLYMSGLMAVWALFGLRISRGIAPLVALLILFDIGGLVAMTQMAELYQTPFYLAVSFFLSFTAIFYASVTESRPDLYPLIFAAWVTGAVVTALLGILGYFDAFPGAGIFTRYSRAMGAFQDPNVFGPFLALPAVYLLHRILAGPPRNLALLTLPLLILVIGIFLSFSRGAWGVLVASFALLTAALYLQSNSGRFRLKLTVMAIVAVAIVGFSVIAILQIPGMEEFFRSRAQLEQDYDSAHFGRFARYGYGVAMALQHPLGIGALNFGRIFGEDTHDIWLKALLDYSWLGFVAFTALVLWTLAAGFRILLRNRPWQPYLLCAYVVFVSHIGLGTIIDIDHWRHLYMLIGLIWGAIGLERRHQRALAFSHRAGSGAPASAATRSPQRPATNAARPAYAPAR